VGARYASTVGTAPDARARRQHLQDVRVVA
jgi:hypothetical protein